MDRRRPAIIIDACDGVEQSSWSFDFLRREVGSTQVPVYDWGDSGPTVEDDFVIRRLPLSVALDELEGSSNPRYSVCQLPVGNVGDLDAHYRTPSWIDAAKRRARPIVCFREPARSALFLSHFRGIHWHNGREAVAQVLEGKKRFILFAPSDTPYLYPRKLRDAPLSWFDETEAVFCSEIPFELGLDSVDLDRFPKYERATPIEVVVEAGEALFIPSHWWHFSMALAPSILVVEFWDAPIRDWGFPIARRTFLMKPYRKYVYPRIRRASRISRRVSSTNPG
ncbi:MAG: hypothetical protein GY716_06900 [bacterium]|nr:hypothetical protein [bacterium]